MLRAADGHELSHPEVQAVVEGLMARGFKTGGRKVGGSNKTGPKARMLDHFLDRTILLACEISRREKIGVVGERVVMPSQRYGRLTVLRFVGRTRNRQDRWACSCACGGTKIVDGRYLRNGLIRSCGCLSRESSAMVLSRLTAARLGPRRPDASHSLADAYVRRLFSTGFSVPVVAIPAPLIALKRIHLETKREIKEQSK